MSAIITFEGIDGSGKTTLMTRLYKHFTDYNKEVWSTSEPWSFASYEIDPDPFAATMQLMADRRRHCRALRDTSCDIVLIDRFDLSTMAYQGWGDGISVSLIQRLNEIATEGVDVNLRLWLDVPVNVAVQRIRSHRGESVSEYEIARLGRVRAGYAEMEKAGRHRRLLRIDATQPPNVVLRDAIALIEGVL